MYLISKLTHVMYEYISRVGNYGYCRIAISAIYFSTNQNYHQTYIIHPLATRRAINLFFSFIYIHAFPSHFRCGT